MNDKVATTCAVGDKDGLVVITFPEPVRYASFDPETARQIGEALAKSSYVARYGKAPSEGSVLSREVRQKLVARIQHVIRSLQDKNNKPKYVAEQVIDTILAEVL